MKEKESLIDLLIHDLTGPLAIVSADVAGLLKREGEQGLIPDRQRKTLERVLRNTNKARTLLQEMIEVYRSNEGLFRSEEVPVNEVVKDALLDAIEMTDPAAREVLSCITDDKGLEGFLQDKKISCIISGKYSHSPFRHDRKKIQQIIRNLITNALKYRRERLTLSVSGDDDLLVTVEDDGVGIPKEKQGYIFKRFFQQKNNIKPAVEGLGFGLSCVKTLIEGMKGEINVNSDEGAGTRFTVRIPSL
jgi:signal transduction histidine kinase